MFLGFTIAQLAAGSDDCLLRGLYYQALERPERKWHVTGVQELFWRLLSCCVGCRR